MPGVTAVPTLDLSHHLSLEARQRRPNAMKSLWKLTKRKANMISLGTGTVSKLLPRYVQYLPLNDINVGDPHYSLYPIKGIHYEVASASEDIEDPVRTWREAFASGSSSASTQWFSSSRDGPTSIPLKSAMAYSTGAGLPEAQQAVTTLTQHFHSPPGDYACTLTVGNMDGVTKLFRLLGSPGDHFLADEFSFNALTNAPLSHGVGWVPVKIDKGGLVPEELERIMDEWEESVHGKRPHVLYTVP